MSRRITVGPFPHYYAIVDDVDYESLLQWKWYARVIERNSTVYAYRRIQDTPKGESTYMHKLITGNEQTDHSNGIGLDNRRINLRNCNNSQNHANRTKYKTTSGKKPSSKYKGVCFDRFTNNWKASTSIDGKNLHLGRFETEEEVARAYDSKARELFGEFARLNFPE